MEIERYIPPPDSELAPYVQSIWRVRAAGGPLRETILPACNLDLLFNFGGPIDRVHVRGREVIDTMAGSAVHMAGLHTAAFATRPRGQVAVLGVSLRIEACAAFVALPPGLVVDRCTDGTSLIPDVAELWPRLRDALDFGEQCRHLVDWLRGRLTRRRGMLWIGAACRDLFDSPHDAQAQAPVTMLARAHGLSTRQVRRRFEQALGIGPAQYVRLARFARAVRLMASRTRLTDVAHAAGYHDQAHFCRDFGAIAGMSPGAYRAAAPAVPGHIFGRRVRFVQGARSPAA